MTLGQGLLQACKYVFELYHGLNLEETTQNQHIEGFCIVHFGRRIHSIYLIDVDIGDIVGGRDYVTGMVMAKPVENKIYTEENGEISKDYTLEGDDGGE